ncbi:ornithine decarboxylase [Pseudomonas putida]|uniref:Orn/Lys/Arg family decarboxylase n=1 Tax=Pseudomonas putida TaxID=303 RepID=UPI002363B7A0|nr:ornithine decarboxylase [Pseudomonas putida]MDD1986477.1 ornithine decarboxylase [Pseudomonas putida]HDS1793177.1 ornithine decarboxylase [Pseudomonas putida]
MTPTIVYSVLFDVDAWEGVQTVPLHMAGNLALASALLLTPDDARQANVREALARWRIPLFIALTPVDDPVPAANEGSLVLPLSEFDRARLTAAALAFDNQVLPPFTRTVASFVGKRRPTFACPGHQGGACLRQHPAGARFAQLLGPGVFHVDVPHAAPELGDVLSHEGPVQQAEQLAARVFGADDTWFVLNGTSTANKVVASALLSAGDLVLMDRNNHKSVFLGALVQCGALPVYLDNVRDERGLLGGYRLGALDEARLRGRVRQICEHRAHEPRPFRLAVIQQTTCDGVVVDAAALLARIGHLCDYVLFDGAWAGYEPFVPTLAGLSPLKVHLTETSPGLVVTQSVHKQMSGLSQTSQIHKKDKHIRHLRRYCRWPVFNAAFMQHASTSPSYPLFMSLEVNAAMLADGEGERHWQQALSASQALRDHVAGRCRFIRPLAPTVSDASTEYLPQGALRIEPGLHHVDPCKVIFITRGKLDIPACLVTQYLRDCDFTPEKTDFYSFTLLMTPSSDSTVLMRLVDALEAFEGHLLQGTEALQVLPSLRAAPEPYHGISLATLGEHINKFYRAHQLEQRQSEIFSVIDVAQADRSPYQANQQFVRGEASLVRIGQVAGRVAAEGVIPYPPGIMCIAPGERWTSALVAYLLAIETLSAQYPEFAPHIQGVHAIRNADGSASLGVFVLG